MRHLGDLAVCYLATAWVMGFVLAKGFWSTVLCFIPLYAWYLTAGYTMEFFGFLPK